MRILMLPGDGIGLEIAAATIAGQGRATPAPLILSPAMLPERPAGRAARHGTGAPRRAGRGIRAAALG